VTLSGLGTLDTGALAALDATSDGRFRTGEDGVTHILAPRDGRVEFVAFERHMLAHVRSLLGSGAYYPVHPVHLEHPVRAVLMDLDGTTVHSEAFWVWMIEKTTASLLDNPRFSLEDADLPFVAGYSVSEHLRYCIGKYCPDRTLEDARRFYFAHAHHELAEVLEGRGRADAFQPARGVKEFLLALKARGVRIAVVTSGLHEKAWPELVAAFRAMGLGDPRRFYDAIITAGFPLRDGEPGTMGELAPKPHPWLYSEACRVGLGVPFEDRHHVIGIEDSGAGVCAIRLAGFTTVGMAGGNIPASGTRPLCQHYCESFADVLALL
jgi:beta-phosphoglucomutase-like phosphatase (HAD superfamily)